MTLDEPDPRQFSEQATLSFPAFAKVNLTSASWRAPGWVSRPAHDLPVAALADTVSFKSRSRTAVR
jgi:hypothetical protein